MLGESIDLRVRVEIFFSYQFVVVDRMVRRKLAVWHWVPVTLLV